MNNDVYMEYSSIKNYNRFNKKNTVKNIDELQNQTKVIFICDDKTGNKPFYALNLKGSN
jgi:hypothetical protein